jgi:hypothetical protein
MLMHIEFHLDDGRTHQVPWSGGEREAVEHAASAIHDGRAVSAVVRDNNDIAVWDSTHPSA